MEGKPTTKAKNKYNAKAYDRLNIIVPKGRRDNLQAMASKQGESLNSFVVTAIDERIDRLESSAGEREGTT